MVAFRKRSFRKKSSTKKRAYKKKMPKSKMSFNKRVKMVVSTMAENKVANFRSALNLVQYRAGVAWLASITPITPTASYLTIAQGSGQSDRTGNSIRVKSLKLTGVIRPTPYDLTTNTDPVPFFVKLFFLTRKDSPTAVYTAGTDVLQYGSTSESFGTGLVNLNRPINTDEWTVHTTRTYKIGFSNYGGTSIDNGAQSWANNDFKLMQFVNIDLTKHCVKNIKFDDNTSNASTRNIVMYANIYYADSRAAPAVEIPCIFEYAIDMQYEDM